MPNGGLLTVPTRTSADTERAGKPVAVEDDDEPEGSDIVPNTGPRSRLSRGPAPSRR